MRPTLATILLAFCALPVGAALAGEVDPSCTHTSWRRPPAWRPPASMLALRAGMRIEPETGAQQTPITELQAMGAARREALSRVPIVTRADGSRYAVLGGLIRAYTVVTVGPDGKLVQECVHSEEAARARVNEAATAPAKEK